AVVDEEAAEQRADHAREGEHPAEVALVLAALTRRDDVADDRLRRRHQPAGADTLEGAEGDEHPHRLRHATEHRSREEDDDGRLEDALAAVEVADLPVEG